MHSPTKQSASPQLAVGFREFVALTAAITGMVALSIDSMLPALPAIAKSFGVTNENDRQWVISVFMLGFGGMQIVYGPLADRYGRKPIAVVTLFLYGFTSIAASFANSFEMLLAARLAQGMAAASGRVITTSVIRDCFEGRTMARVMSLSFMVFLIVPILAPTIGQLILFIAPWRWIFHFLALFGFVCAFWFAWRLPETLREEHRRPIEVRLLLAAARTVITDRSSLGYTLAGTLVFGSLMGYIMSSQQIFSEVFDAAAIFPLIFALTAGSMGVASYLNSHIVERLGTRLVSHTALLCFIGMAALHLLWVLSVGDTLISFAIFQCITFFFLGLTGGNFGAMAMEEMGPIAGMAASIQGTLSTLMSAGIGTIIGQSFDGTNVPLTVGYLVCGLSGLVIVFISERGQLFKAHHAPPVSRQ